MVKETMLLNRAAVPVSLILSKVVHAWILLPNPPDSLFDVLQKTVYEFVWNTKQDRIIRLDY